MIVNKCTRENSETVGRNHTESRTDNKGAPLTEAGRDSDGGKLCFIPCFSEKKGNGYRPEGVDKGLLFFEFFFSFVAEQRACAEGKKCGGSGDMNIRHVNGRI